MNRSKVLQQLVQARLEHLQEAASIRTQNAKPVELDQSRVGRLSRQDALQSQAISKAALARHEEELRRLRAALRRLKCGELGWCMECGCEIPIERLRIDPASEFCVSCADSLGY